MTIEPLSETSLFAQPEPPPPRMLHPVWHCVIWFVVTIGAAIACGLIDVEFPPVDGWERVRIAIAAGILPGLFAGGWLLTKAFTARHDMRGVYVAAAVLALTGLPFWAHAVLTLVNGAKLDPARTTHIRTPVVAKHQHYGKRLDSRYGYHVYVADWDRKGKDIVLDMNRANYDRSIPNSSWFEADVTLGRLGFRFYQRNSLKIDGVKVEW